MSTAVSKDVNYQKVADATGIDRGIFVSDLHLLTSRSRGEAVLKRLAPFQRQQEAIVLGGDTFDFRWSCVQDLARSMRFAINWLERLLEATGNSRMFYLLGNHDCLPQFQHELEQIQRENPRFQLVEHALQVHDCLFLHGDILDAGGVEQLAAYRERFHHQHSKADLLHRCYDAIVALRIPSFVSRTVRPKRTTCSRLQTLLDALDLSGEVKRVFFGHTHVSVHGLEVGKQKFFNPGSGIQHMALHPVEFQIPADQRRGS